MSRKKRKAEVKRIKEIEHVQIVTNEFSEQTSIQINFSNGERDNLWRNSVVKRLGPYSESQIKEIRVSCKSQIVAMSDDKIPEVFKEIIKELEEVMKNKGIDI